MNKITKAIIPVAGYGTRMLPITKAIEKCMLPVCNRPTIDYIVKDCIAAGITDIYFVVSEGSAQIKKYYSENTKLVDYLNEHNKKDKLPLITPPSGINFHYIEQDPNGKYGNAVPVALTVEKYDINERVAVLMGDDFIYNTDGSSELQKLINSLNDDESGMLSDRVDKSEVYRYGVLSIDEKGYLTDFVEKPSVEEAPSNQINISKWVLSAEVLDNICKYVHNNNFGPEHEYYITDPILDSVKNGAKLKVLPTEGKFLDCGKLEGWLYANEVVNRDLLKK